MEKSKPVGYYSSSSSSSSSSSIATELFGPKDSSSSSSTSSIFSSVFGPPPMVKGRDSSNLYAGNQTGNAKHGIPAQNSKGESSKEKSSYYQQETVGPCHLSSSIYYGGQEVYSPTTCTSDSQLSFKKDGRDDDPDGGNTDGASRGNWWQGSLYY
ncbi:hypothetical protein Ancab_005869 [Ancistrocladus abbreviatus]